MEKVLRKSILSVFYYLVKLCLNVVAKGLGLLISRSSSDGVSS